ncbi:MAG: DUF2793 domain-containing protein [Pseudomonadota bacterium]
MTETPNLSLPLIQPSQAQKHVTVNEALVRVDAAAQLVLQETGRDAPPASISDGFCYAIGDAPSGDWAGHAGEVAVADNGGWTFLAPRQGWRAWDAAGGHAITHGAAGWVADGFGASASGAGARFVTEEAIHDIVPGPQNVMSITIPAKVTLFAAAARVVSDVTGTAASWRLGEAGATDRFGSGLGLLAGSYADGLLGQPQAYYADVPLVVTGEGGDLSGGQLRIALHYLAYALPGI